MKITIAADPGVQTTAAAAAAASGFGTWWTMAKDVALELFGVPLPVVLACATAAYGALSFISGMGYMRTAFSGVCWTAIGTWGAAFALWLIKLSLEWVFSRPLEIPTGVLAGAGMVVSGLGPFVVTRENLQKLAAAVGRVIDGFGKGGQT